MTKINNTGIISKKIVTDNLYNTQGNKYLTDADLGGASGNFQEILDNAVQQATEDAKEAKVLAETAAVNALESERNVTLKAEEIISQVTLEAEEIISQVTSEAKEAKVLAETAAVNALESERNVTNLSENLSEHISEILSADGEIRITSGHALGDFYFSITSRMPEGVLPLNGSEVSRVTYSDLYDYVLNIHNELSASDKKFIVSEEEWQNISIENNGYVPYYSYGTLNGMFRLPRMSGYLKATGELDEAGNYVAEGLPNITGSFQSITNYMSDNISEGAVYGTSAGDKQIGGGGSGNHIRLSVDASLSNPIYGNSEHVTPETNTLFVGIWALTAFTQVGTANLNEIKEIITEAQDILSDNSPLLSYKIANKGLKTSSWKHSSTEWLDGRIYSTAFNFLLEKISEGARGFIEMRAEELISPTEFPYDFLVDTHENKFRLPIYPKGDRFIVKEYKNDVQWYRIYNDGYVEQGGEINATATANTVVNLLIPFIDTSYTVVKSLGVNGVYNETISGITVSTWNYTTTTFTARTNTSAGLDKWRWFAFGFGEVIPQEEQETEVYYKVSNGSSNHVINIEEKLTEFEETAYTRLDEVVEEVSKDYVVHVDKQVGELYFSFDNYCPDSVIPLDGRLVSRATYADLWQWVQEKDLVKDDALITTNDENTVSIFNEDGSIRYCQWYGSGDGSLTFRMPKLNGYLGVTGDNTLAGQYTAEGLPNITGTLFTGGADAANVSGAFTTPESLTYQRYGTGGGYSDQDISTIFDASLSNSIYGNAEHVIPETNTLFVGVWAITAAKAAVFDMRDVEEALKSAESYLMNNVPLMSSRWDRDGLGNLGWVKADGSWIDGRTYTGAYNYCVEKLVSGHDDFIDGQVAAITTDNCSKFIVDRINKRFRLPVSNGQRQLVAAYKEGTQWYNIYSDGWIEQGGEIYNSADAVVTVELLVPYNDTTYTVDKILGVDARYTSTVSGDYTSTWGYTTTSFQARTHTNAALNRFRWFAAGYGEVLSLFSPLRTSHLYFKLAHEFYAPAQAEIQEKLDLIDNLVAKTDINLPTLSSRWDSDFAENVGWVKSEGQWLNGNTYRDAYDLMVSRIGIHDKFIEATAGTELSDENADKFLIDTTAVKFRLPLINGERVVVKRYDGNRSGSYDGGKYQFFYHNSYEVYSDGYCKQSLGHFEWLQGGSGTINLLLPYKNKYYNVVVGTTDTNNSVDTLGGDAAIISGELVKTETSIRISAAKSQAVYLHTDGFVNILTPADYNCNTYLFFKLADEVPSTVVDTQQVIDDLHEEAINFKNECSQTLAQGDFVIETWRDGYNWYRLYNSGWIEQGGMGGAATTTYSVTLHKEMADANYHVNLTSCEHNSANYNIVCNNRTTTGFEIYGSADGAKAATKMWEVKGFIKQN